MSEETPVSSSDAVRQQTVKTLSKYTTVQLEAKLGNKALLGLSKEVAEEIVAKRKEQNPEAKGSEPAINPIKEESTSVSEAKAEKKPAKKEVVKKEKESKPKVHKEPRLAKKEVVKIDPEDAKVKAILTDKDSTKTEKIQSLLKLNYSITQISKKYFPKLDAHYSFVYGISKRKEVTKPAKSK